MAKCWTCGKLTSEPVYKCSTCRNERSLSQKTIAESKKISYEEFLDWCDE